MPVDERILRLLLEGMGRTALAVLLLERAGHDVLRQKQCLMSQYDLAAALIQSAAKAAADKGKVGE